MKTDLMLATADAEEVKQIEQQYASGLVIITRTERYNKVVDIWGKVTGDDVGNEP